MRYKPTELKAFLRDSTLFPKKKLSQNFLIDGNIIKKIVKLANISKEDHILEIGSGPGALTEALLQTKAQITAVEMDAEFAKALSSFQTNDQRLSIFSLDFLKFDVETFCKKIDKKIKVVANLPYHITTPILAKLLPLFPYVESLTIMVQKEVAHRFLAQAGTKEWNSFSLFLRFYATPVYGFTVSPTCFYPPPKVDSAVIQILLKKPPSISSEKQFFEMTRTAFGQRRKMLKVSLKKLYSAETIEKALLSLGKKRDIRPETLSLEEFLALFEIIKQTRKDTSS